MTGKTGFIGAGKMSEALIRGFIESGAVSKKDVLVSDISNERLGYIKKTFGVMTTGDNTDVAEQCTIIVLCVKPSDMKQVLSGIRTGISKKKIYISVAAGVNTGFLESNLREGLKIVRVMPNTPCLIGEGAIGLYFNNNVDEEEKEMIISMFTRVGMAEVFPDEEHLDAVTGLSGSGPAFVSMFIESMADGGVKMGLSRDSSLRLAAKTVLGTARMILETGISPPQLKDMVSSPGGTTIEGISRLEENRLRYSVISAVEAATERSKSISYKGED